MKGVKLEKQQHKYQKLETFQFASRKVSSYPSNCKYSKLKNNALKNLCSFQEYAIIFRSYITYLLHFLLSDFLPPKIMQQHGLYPHSHSQSKHPTIKPQLKPQTKSPTLLFQNSKLQHFNTTFLEHLGKTHKLCQQFTYP